VLASRWLSELAIIWMLSNRSKLTIMPIMRRWGAMRRSAQERARRVPGYWTDFVTPWHLKRGRMPSSSEAIPPQGSSAKSILPRSAWATSQSSSAHIRIEILRNWLRRSRVCIQDPVIVSEG